MAFATRNIPTPSHADRRSLALAAGLLLLWGLGFWGFNALFFKFAHFFALTPLGTAFAFGAFHLAYVLVAIPAVLFHRKFGYKIGILVGLSAFGIAAFLFYPAMARHSHLYFLCAVPVVGACVAWLDSSLNPLAAMAGSKETAVKRLNLAQAFNGVGVFCGYVIAVSLLGPRYLSTDTGGEELVRPYMLVGLAAIFLAFVIEQITLPRYACSGSGAATPWRRDLGALMRDRRFGFTALALGAYSIAIAILWTANYRYNEHVMASHAMVLVERGSFWLAMGRICAVVLLRWLSPMRLLQLCTALCIPAIIIAVATGGSTGWFALLACSFLLASAYPTIFGTGLQDNWTRMALAAGLMVMASGIGNVLACFSASLALDVLMIDPRAVILAALPFALVVLVYALKSGDEHV